jgi:hypothetical protein
LLRYFEIDYTTNTITEYARHGACNGCGACCTGEMHYIVSEHPGLNMYLYGGGTRTDGRGIWQVVTDGNEWRYHKFIQRVPTKQVCPHLCSKRCLIHGDHEPLFCQLWPISQREAEAFGECGYTFEKIGETSLLI